MRHFFHKAWDIIVTFFEQEGLRLAAATSFYTILSLAPLMILILLILQWVLGNQLPEERFFEKLQSVTGMQSIEPIRSFMENMIQLQRDISTIVVSLLVLMTSSSNLFHHMNGALNDMWEIEYDRGTVIGRFLHRRIKALLLSFALAGAVLLSLFANVFIYPVAQFVAKTLEMGTGLWILLGENVFAFVLSSLFFALVFAFVPDARIAPRVLALGSTVTGALFTVGGVAAGYILAQRDFGNFYGSAGAVILILLWIYYVSALVFLGAAFTNSMAQSMGRPIVSRQKSPGRS